MVRRHTGGRTIKEMGRWVRQYPTYLFHIVDVEYMWILGLQGEPDLRNHRLRIMLAYKK
jgi:hypothetical protein